MNINNELYKLNNLLSKRVFCEGDFRQKIKEIVKGYAPFSKVAFITLFNTHSLYSKEILSSIKGVSSKLISLVIKDAPKNDISVFDKMFNLPEDIRVVITFDKELVKLCSYYASIRNILFIYVPQSCYINGVLNNFVYLKNGEKIDRVKLDTNIRVILDFNLIKENGIADGYASIMGKTLALIDYRIYCEINDVSAKKLAINLLKDTILNTYKLFSSYKSDRAKKVIINSCYIEVANFMLDNALTFSSAEICKILCENAGGDIDDMGNMLYVASKILKIYGTCFSIDKPLEIMPSMSERANILSSILKVSSTFIAENLLVQNDLLGKNNAKVIKVISSMGKQVNNISNNFNSVISCFIALNGNDKAIIHYDEVATLIKVSGDYPYSLNGLSVLRYLGITDLDIFD